MGNNILLGKRKDNKLEVLNMVEDLCKATISTLNNEQKFPKRQRNIYGQHIVEHALCGYEKLRFANTIYPASIAQVEKRYELVNESEYHLNSLISDLNLLPVLLDNDTIKESRWYNDLQKQAITTEAKMKNYRISETKRFHNDLNKFKKNKKQKVENKDTVEELTSPIIFIDKKAN